MSIGVWEFSSFRGFSRWSLDNSSFGRMEMDKKYRPDSQTPRLPNSKGQAELEKIIFETFVSIHAYSCSAAGISIFRPEEPVRMKR